MRRLISVVVAMLAVALTAVSNSWPQEPKRPTIRSLPPNGQAWRIEKIADIPPPLKSAIDRTQCRLEEYILHESPIQIFRIGRTVIGLVTCQGIIWYGRAFVFEHDPSVEPKPVLFPILASPSGVGTSEMPGYLAWDASTKILTATRGNDVGGGDEFRHVYRYDGRLFTLIRVETQKCCRASADEAWTPIWDAPAWPPPPR
jgi:hypothetical protein